MTHDTFWSLLSSPFLLLIPALHTLGALHAIQAIMKARSSQAAIAWAISLTSFPYVAVPLYWIFGRDKFFGYVEAMRSFNTERLARIRSELAPVYACRREIAPEYRELQRSLEVLAPLPFTHGNAVELLIDGQATFESIFSSIDRATSYILVQFYIMRDDRVGRELQARLIRRAKEGVKVYVLYDEIGSLELPDRYVETMEREGIRVMYFHSRKGRANRFQINFRNHRKIVVVDGTEGFIGGHNVGNEYLGLDPRLGAWRDTHVRVRGPAVQALQVPFAMDWFWAAREPLNLVWSPPTSSDANALAIVVPTSPSDSLETAELFFLSLINSAKRRIWIASPYFVPDDSIMRALQLAVTRGVEVRIVIPEKPDHLLVYFAAFSFFEDALESGIKLYRYQKGFLHQKAILIDDEIASIGTKNLDNRSLHLNFEVSLVVWNREFAASVDSMFQRDFSEAKQVKTADYSEHGFVFRVWVRIARLFAPIL